MLEAIPVLAFYIVLTGLDDLFIDLAWLCLWLRRGSPQAPTASDLDRPERSMAIFVPLWHEHEVIGQMIAHNIAALRYSNYEFFVGVYPNDRPTIEAVSEMQTRLPNVHLAVAPHDGPTSKADCLNWIFQHMLLYEESKGRHFDCILTHDAEDIIHADSLRWMNFYVESYDFIQIPVLALHTPIFHLTHGVYCDEFAEFQTRDLVVRNRLGGFIPSAGVGTAYSRQALEALAEARSNRIFEPSALTEDYENGLRLHQLGFRQLFMPPIRNATDWVATREYFPRRWRAAVRQRTRWVTGIALQGWQNHGWRGDWRHRYWLWRDRKGLLGGPVGLLTNLLSVYGLATGVWTRALVDPFIAMLCAAALGMQVVRTAVRIGCVQRVYGWKFAALVPVRAVFANSINATANVRALWRFGKARIKGEPLTWLKTQHSYPSRVMLESQRRKIGEILVGSGWVSEPVFAAALESQPAGTRIGMHLMSLGLLSEDDLYEALSIQQGVPLGVDSEVSAVATRTLPAHVMAGCNVLPFKIASGKLYIAGTDLPTEALHCTLRSYTSLEIRFHLVTPTLFARLTSSVPV